MKPYYFGVLSPEFSNKTIENIFSTIEPKTGFFIP